MHFEHNNLVSHRFSYRLAFWTDKEQTFVMEASHLSPAVSPLWRQCSRQNVSFNEAVFFIRVTSTQRFFNVLNSWWSATTKILHLPQIPSINPYFPASLFTSTPVGRKSHTAKIKQHHWNIVQIHQHTLLQYFILGLWKSCSVSFYFLWNKMKGNVASHMYRK